MGEGRRSLSRVVRLFDRALETMACGLLIALLLTVLAGVVSRASGAPLIWTDEGARLVMVWLACFGWMIAGRRRAHVRIRFFQDLLPAALHRGTELVIQVAMAVLGCALAWWGWALVGRNWDLDATSLPISIAWLYVPMIPAGLMMAGQAVVQVVERRPVAVAAPVIE